LRIGKGGFTFDLAAKGVRWALRSLHPSDSHQWREIHHTGNFPPIGFCYIQYPGTETPSSLFGGTWTAMFETEGVFFRTPGGNASAFGSGVQADEFKAHNHTGSTNSAGAHTHSYATFDEGTWGQSSGAHVGGRTATKTTSSSGAHTHTLSINNRGGNETRPVNRTFRVWRKTA